MRKSLSLDGIIITNTSPKNNYLSTYKSVLINVPSLKLGYPKILYFISFVWETLMFIDILKIITPVPSIGWGVFIPINNQLFSLLMQLLNAIKLEILFVLIKLDQIYSIISSVYMFNKS